MMKDGCSAERSDWGGRGVQRWEVPQVGQGLFVVIERTELVLEQVGQEGGGVWCCPQ